MHTRIRLFVLDDDDATRLQIIDALDKAEIEDYDMFESHEDFFANLDEFVHIAIIDHSLVGTDGMEVMKRLLITNPLCYIIIISGNSDPNLVIRYQRNGSSVFVKKNDNSFTSDLMMFVHIAYRKIKAMLELRLKSIEAIANIKLPTDHGQDTVLAGAT